MAGIALDAFNEGPLEAEVGRTRTGAYSLTLKIGTNSARPSLHLAGLDYADLERLCQCLIVAMRNETTEPTGINRADAPDAYAHS